MIKFDNLIIFLTVSLFLIFNLQLGTIRSSTLLWDTRENCNFSHRMITNEVQRKGISKARVLTMNAMFRATERLTRSSLMMWHSNSSSQPSWRSFTRTSSPTFMCRRLVASARSEQVVVFPVPSVPVIRMFGLALSPSAMASNLESASEVARLKAANLLCGP